MEYEVEFADGSTEIVEADDIREARARGQELYECGIKRITVLSDDDDEADNPDDDEDEEDEEDEDDEDEDEE